MALEETRLPAIFDELQIGITLHHPETGAILDVNRRLEELYGYTRAELRAMRIEDYSSPAERFTQERAVRQIREAADGRDYDFTWQIEQANGEHRWVQVHLTDIEIDGHVCVVAEISDITGYKSHENLLQLLSRVVRHNLRNEMSVLLGYTDRLRSALETDRFEDEIDAIEAIASDVGRLSDSIAEIEYITNPNARDRTNRSLESTVRAHLKDRLGSDTDATFTVTVEQDTTVLADEGLDFAIEHAIDNAIEHDDADTPSVDIRVEHDAERGVGIVRILDEGPLIPDIEQRALEEAVATSNIYHGSGVGLWVMKSCVESMGGELTFAERPTGGNVVSLCLPEAGPAA